jgi:hypothetical protein
MTKAVDPIFAAIAAHKCAAITYGLTLEADEEAAVEALDRQRDALDAMLNTEPTSVAGALAKLKHLGEDVYDDGNSWTVYTYALELYDDGVHKNETVEQIRRLPLALAATLERLIKEERDSRPQRPIATAA